METLRLCEWGQTRVDRELWPIERRRQVQDAAQEWREMHCLNALPLEWSGSDGCTLQSRQWVGVVEVDGACIEIYPKTDKAFLQRNELSAQEGQSTLRVLLRMLEASYFSGWNEAGSAALAQGELTFIDLWAGLFATHLRDELRRGLVRDYIGREDDLYTVRGRIDLPRQLTRYADRLDRVACRWDDYSPDIPLLRLLKCATRLLHRRAHHVGTIGLLSDCLLMLDDVQDVTPAIALQQNRFPRWPRAHSRLRMHFELGRWIVRELGPQTQAGPQSTWTFFVDMNQVFENFVGAALQERYEGVETQQTLGHLITGPCKRHQQIADYVWQGQNGICIGDAKWKLAQTVLSNGVESDDELIAVPGGALKINPADIRQLTTYAELYHCQKKSQVSELMLFYPALGWNTAVSWVAWNGARFRLVPVELYDWQRVGQALLLSE